MHLICDWAIQFGTFVLWIYKSDRLTASVKASVHPFSLQYLFSFGLKDAIVLAVILSGKLFQLLTTLCVNKFEQMFIIWCVT